MPTDKDCTNCGHNLVHPCHFASCQKNSRWIPVGDGLANIIKAEQPASIMSREQRKHMDKMLYPRR